MYSLFTYLKATSHLSVRLTAMRVTVNEVPSHLCKILTLIIVKTYLQTWRRRYCIARRPVVTCYNPATARETSKTSLSVQKRIRFPLDAQVVMAFTIEIMPNFLQIFCNSILLFQCVLSKNDNA